MIFVAHWFDLAFYLFVFIYFCWVIWLRSDLRLAIHLMTISFHSEISTRRTNLLFFPRLLLNLDLDSNCHQLKCLKLIFFLKNCHLSFNFLSTASCFTSESLNPLFYYFNFGNLCFLFIRKVSKPIESIKKLNVQKKVEGVRFIEQLSSIKSIELWSFSQ